MAHFKNQRHSLVVLTIEVMDAEKYNLTFQEHGALTFLLDKFYYFTHYMCRFGKLMPDPEMMRRVLNAW